ncbi:hypothetical protein P3T73_13980 [Kiritimatiellota bacterium B12222]|nr:hypothetical protein P3T73_13980 [Kiritimatiellota bacterium B12222]
MRIKLCTFILVLATLTLAAIAFWWAPLNQDEGWYLMAARRVSQGQMPYRDFAFTQAPLFPYIFQFAQPLVNKWGLAGGRLFQYVWFAMTFGILLWNCKQRCRPKTFYFATLVIVSLLGLNVFQMQYAATVKTYVLAGFFLSLSMWGWLSYVQTQQRRALFLCAWALAAATATRLSLGLFFMPLGLSLLLNRQKNGDLAWILFALTGAAGLTLSFGPFLLLAPEGLRFALLDYHAARQIDAFWMLKAGFLSRMVQSYFPALIILLMLLPQWKTWQPGLRSMFLGIVSVTILHLLAPFPYDDYQVALYPALILLIAIESAHQFSTEKQNRLAPLLSMSALLFAFSSAQVLTWFSYGQDRIWWKTKTQSDLHTLQQAAKSIQALNPSPKLLLTTDSYLAIETGYEIPEDMEMGAFAYFPKMDLYRAEKLHVLNTQRLRTLLQNSPAPLAAISGYSFAIQSPAISPTPGEQLQALHLLLEERYEPIREIENFGQGHTPLTIYRLKQEPSPSMSPLPRP